jgi:hypothetical protein
LVLRINEEIQTNETVKQFTDDGQKFALTAAATEVKIWIQEHADEVENETVFIEKYKKLGELISPVYGRIAENRTLGIAIQAMYQTIRLAKFSVLAEWPVNKTYLNKTVVQNFTNWLNETETWFLKALESMLEVPLWESKPFKWKDFEDRRLPLMKELVRIQETKGVNKPGFWASAKNWLRGLVKKTPTDPPKRKVSNSPRPKASATVPQSLEKEQKVGDIPKADGAKSVGRDGL